MDIFACKHASALFVYYSALLVHYIIVLKNMLADLKIAALYLFLRTLDLL